MKTPACYRFRRVVLIHWLGVKVVQQVVRVAVAVSAHHHQGNEGGQENGGQHPNGHNHHCLHGDSGSHSGCRLQLVKRKKKKKRVQSGLADCPSSIMDGRSSVEGRIIGGFSLIGCDIKPEKNDFITTLNLYFCWNTKHIRIHGVSVSKCGTPSMHTTNWSLSEYIKSWSVLSLCLHFIWCNENNVW